MEARRSHLVRFWMKSGYKSPGKMLDRMERMALKIMRDLIKAEMKNLHYLIFMLGVSESELDFRNLESRSDF